MHNTYSNLVDGCPDYIFNAGIQGGAPFFGGSFGGTYSANCEARLDFNLNARLADIDSTTAITKASIGPCNWYGEGNEIIKV